MAARSPSARHARCTAIVEVALASSDRPSFVLARLCAGVVRPVLERAARRLWVDDGAYAERLFRVRTSRG